MEIVPCSHVGHLFRISTYSFDGNAEDIKSRNSLRLVEVWMNELKNLIYTVNPSNKIVFLFNSGKIIVFQEIKIVQAEV